MAFYGDGTFYGSGAFYRGATSTANGQPQGLSFYRTTQDGIYTFDWGFLPEFIAPGLAGADYELQLDTVDTFDSPNLVDFTSANVITFQNGNVRKGFTIPVAARVNKVEQTWYARVRTLISGDATAWSDTLIWTIPQNTQEQYAEELMLFIPDAHVYGKEDLLKPLNQRNTNLYTIEDMYAQQLDAAWYENFLTKTDTFIALTRDEKLYGIWGVLFKFQKPVNMQFVDYRWILQQLIAAALVGSTNQAVIDVIQAFTGVPPGITNIRDLNDFTLITIQDAPIVPSGPQSVFFTSEPYIGSTLVVENLTTGLLVQNSTYTTNETQGSWTMDVPTTDTLQGTFDIGNPRDPFPIVFDGTDYTAISGTVTFTKGSQSFTGTGTTFLADLTVGEQITNATGIYLGTIENIADNTHGTFTLPWFGDTETVPAFRERYTDIQLPPPVLWDQGTLGFGVIITIFNPGEFPLDINLIEALTNALLPAFVKVYYQIQ